MGIFVLFLEYMCIPPPEKLVACIEKKEKTKEMLICMEDICKEKKNVFSLADTVFMCF